MIGFGDEVGGRGGYTRSLAGEECVHESILLSPTTMRAIKNERKQNI
jgi:hypothetical protein